jgi:hypothetical protein
MHVSVNGIRLFFEGTKFVPDGPVMRNFIQRPK